MEETEQKKKNNIFKKWWFWIIVIIFIPTLIYEMQIEIQNTQDYLSSFNFINNDTIQTSSKESEIKDSESSKENNISKEEKEKQNNIENTKWTLYATTEQVVKNRLKVPQTAKFSNQKAIYDDEQQIYKIQGNVVAENSFGGTVNSTFYAEYNNELDIIYMTFDNEILVDNK